MDKPITSCLECFWQDKSFETGKIVCLKMDEREILEYEEMKKKDFFPDWCPLEDWGDV